MIVFGADPGLHRTGLAVADHDTCYAVEAITIPNHFKREDALRRMILALRTHIPTLIDLLDMEKYPLPEFVVVEGSEIYYGKNKSRYEDLMNLSKVAGAIAGVVTEVLSLSTFTSLRVPKPNDWKGNRPKPIHQSSVLHSLGWSYKKISTHAYPINPPEEVLNARNLSKDDWKEVTDAIGLAMWGANLRDWQRDL